MYKIYRGSTETWATVAASIQTVWPVNDVLDTRPDRLDAASDTLGKPTVLLLFVSADLIVISQCRHVAKASGERSISSENGDKRDF